MARLSLPDVTLCAVTSVNVQATVEALHLSLDQVDFAQALLLTDASCDVGADVRLVPIERLHSAFDYSRFVLRQLADHIDTKHCLLVQWDGFVLDASAWDPKFLDFDYIGAPWPQFADERNVGNGGFSLRSSRLLRAGRDSRISEVHPEDVAICRTYRDMLEQDYGIRIADTATAARFAFERGAKQGRSFGFHGVFNMIPALGADRFWKIYRSLDDRNAAFTDYRLLMRQLGASRHKWGRRIAVTRDRLSLRR